MTRAAAEREVRDGFWVKVRARLRPLQQGEAPPGTEAADRRMVEFFHQEGTKAWPDCPDPFDDYLPLREPELMGEFLHVFGRDRSPTDAEVIGFYARYGPIRESVMREGKRYPAWAERLEPEDEARLSGVARAGLCEPLWWLRERARELRLTYDIYVALVEDRKAVLHAILGDIPRGKYLRRAQIVAGRIVRDVADTPIPLPPPRDPSTPPSKAGLHAWRVQRDELSRRVAADLLADQLNKAEAKSKRLWVVSGRAWATSRKGEPEGEPRADALRLVRTRRISDLMTAMYLQLGEFVEERTVLRQCPGCDRLFHPARRNQDYCTARCGDAARQRLYYRDRKEKSAEPSS